MNRCSRDINFESNGFMYLFVLSYETLKTNCNINNY